MRKSRRLWQGVRAFLIAVIFIIGIAAPVFYFYNLAYFKIARIQIKNSNESIQGIIAPSLNAFLGKNIFEYNLLQDVKSSIEAMQIPYLKKAVVLRRLPDTIFVALYNRKGVAQIKEKARFYIVDEEGFILTAPSSEPYPVLTVLEGIEEKASIVRIGKRYDSEYLIKALEFLNYISSSDYFKDKDISTIDISNIGDVSFWVKGVEVRFGDWDNDSPKKLDILKDILLDAAVKDTKPKYIDLRFENPVIGTK